MIKTLAPVAFAPDVAVAAMDPAALDPVRVRVRRPFVDSRDPDVAGSVPAMVAGVPGPVTVLRRRGGNDFDGTWRRWADADDDLGTGHAGPKQHGTGDG
jgi:hypothetical protein